MKTIDNFICEKLRISSKSNTKPNEQVKINRFTLNEDERDNLTEILGYASGSLGEHEDIAKFDEFRKSLSQEEFTELPSLYDVLDDRENYPKFTNKILTKEDISIFTKLFAYLNELDEWDLSCEADTMGLPY